uniref:Uncharacterized protein n=1 Tax=viral metagenome TaxID=1070528 RepID=A0A6H1ZAM7_9ZZZZ
MEAKLLNLAEALKVYAIVGKAIEEFDSIPGALLSLTSDEFIQCAEIMLGKTKEELAKEDNWSIVETTIAGVEQNMISELATVVKYLGVK